ncbi:MAG: N utilization substance protein B, partial [Caulobacteraceae bacterium]|nr:N utilization substance protein B [Caulobacteraceae bacterium]
MKPARKPAGKPARQARSVARLAAVQALYQMEASGVGAEAVVREFVEHRFDHDVDGTRLAVADQAFFAALVGGVVAAQGD